MKNAYSVIVLTLLVLGSAVSTAYATYDIIRYAVVSGRSDGIAPGVILIVIELVFLLVAVVAFVAARRGEAWVRWYLCVIAVLAILIFLGNVRVAVRLMNAAFVAPILLFGSAALVYRPATTVVPEPKKRT